VICDINDDSQRQTLCEKEISTIVHEFLTSMEEKKCADTGMQDALGAAMTEICVRRPGDFDVIWQRENEWFEDTIHKAPSLEFRDTTFQTTANRWMTLVSSILNHFNSKNLDSVENSRSSVSTFINSLAQIFTKIVDTEIQTEGNWVEGMSFINLFFWTKPFVDCFQKPKEMDSARKSLKLLLSPDQVKRFLHSQALGPFIGIIIRFNTIYGKDNNSAWDILLAEAIPQHGPIGVRNPESLFRQLASGLNGARREDFKAPPRGVSWHLVDEMSKALELQEAGSLKGMDMEDLWVELIPLRGITTKLEMELTLGILISDETALALVQTLGLDYDPLIPLIGKIIAREETFAELLVSAPYVGRKSKDSKEWNIPAFLLKLYQTQSDPYFLVLCF